MRYEIALDSSMAHGRWLINLNPNKALQCVVARGAESKRSADLGQIWLQCSQSITVTMSYKHAGAPTKHEAQTSQTSQILL